MATKYPTALDDNDTVDIVRVQGSGRKEPHLENLVEGYKALQAKAGIDGSTVTTSLSYRAPILGSGAPASGTSGTGAGAAPPGATYVDLRGGGVWVNEGTKASPYWSPTFTPGMANTWGYFSDFRDGVGKAVADSAESAVLPSGWRVTGDGIAEDDSGAVVQAAGEGGAALRLTTTDEIAHVVGLVGQLVTSAGPYQPDQHGRCVLDVELTHVSAITDRAGFVGMAGLAADSFVEPVTGATTTTTLVLDDVFGVFFDTAFTDVDRLYVAHNKSDAAATQDAEAGSRDTGVNIPAAATRVRLRVEIDENGAARVFKDKALIFSAAAMVDVDEELNPMIYIAANGAATKSMDVFRAMFVANRSAA